MAGGGEAPFGEAREGIDAEVDVGFVAQFAQGGLEAGAGDGGAREVERHIERLLIKPIGEAGLQYFEDAGLEQRFGVGVGEFDFGLGFHIYFARDFFDGINGIKGTINGIGI